MWALQVGNVAAITAGHNIGRVGTIQSTEKHPGSHNIVHVKDKTGASWATRQVTEHPTESACVGPRIAVLIFIVLRACSVYSTPKNTHGS